MAIDTEGEEKLLKKRRVKRSRTVIQGITRTSLRRLARRGGVKFVSAAMYERARAQLHSFLERVLGKAIALAEHSRRRRISSLDITRALEQLGQPLYGFVDAGFSEAEKEQEQKGRKIHK
eukprot:scaffold596_cov236-Pinguiococcus_pyrenoidosus.AAC.27